MAEAKLVGVDARLGQVVRSWNDFVDDVNFSVITVAIKPQWDLVPDHDIQIDLCTAPGLENRGGVIVRLVDSSHTRHFPSDIIVHNGGRPEISLPALHKYRYPLSVWFFSVRLLLKRPNLDTWRASVLTQDFWHVPTSRPPTAWYQASLDILPGAGRNKGRRKYMEDVEVVFENIKVNQFVVNVYGVLDGHGGEDCSHHSAEDIPMKITANLRRGMPCAEALFKSFRDTDEEYLRAAKATAGSTANIILFDKSHSTVYIANTGDTRAILCRNGVALDLSLDRKATDPEEIARIAHAGGFVVNNRVSGSLAITRAIGDGQLKAAQKDILIPDPEITFFVPSLLDQFVVVATDGLWDVVTSQEAADYVRISLEELGVSFRLDAIDNMARTADDLKPKLDKVAMDLVNHAIGMGSADNVTVMILFISGASLEPAVLAEYVTASAAAASTPVSSAAAQSWGLGAISRQNSGRFASDSELPSSGSSDPVVPPKSILKVHSLDEDDDDLMDFLKDDRNF